MADVSKIAANGIDYNVKDANARTRLSTAESNITDAQTAIYNLTSLANNDLTRAGDNWIWIPNGAGSYGTMIQWGVASMGANVTSVWCNFGISFGHTNYVFLYAPDTTNALTKIWHGGKQNNRVQVSRETSSDTQTVGIEWVAVGKMARW